MSGDNRFSSVYSGVIVYNTIDISVRPQNEVYINRDAILHAD